MIERGDIIELRRIEREGAVVRDVWLPMIVTETFDGSFAAKGFRGQKLDDQGHDRIMLRSSDKGQTWR
jgi:photosystem II stability/assembly factor-like uncharacterized protein